MRDRTHLHAVQPAWHSYVREYEIHAVQDSNGLIARANVRRFVAESGEHPTHDLPKSYFILDNQDLHALVKVPWERRLRC
jgi:hypothetical protein